MNTQLSTNSKSIMSALLAGPALSATVATSLGLSVPVVTGSLAGLKKGGFIEVLPTKELKLTQAGIQLLTPAQAIIEYAKPKSVASTRSKGDVKARAAAIVAEEVGSKRAVIVKRFVDDLGMSPQGASTYHYMLCGQRGKWKTN